MKTKKREIERALAGKGVNGVACANVVFVCVCAGGRADRVCDPRGKQQQVGEDGHMGNSAGKQGSRKQLVSKASQARSVCSGGTWTVPMLCPTNYPHIQSPIGIHGKQSETAYLFYYPFAPRYEVPQPRTLHRCVCLSHLCSLPGFTELGGLTLATVAASDWSVNFVNESDDE